MGSEDVVCDALRRARKRVEAGWTKGHVVKVGAAKVCAWVAMHEVDLALQFVPYGTVEAAFLSANPDIRCHTITWNDAPERTIADVLAAFDRAISKAEGAPTGRATAKEGA